MSWPSVILVSFAYLLTLFFVAWWADRRADEGRSVIASPYVYALSLGVYCTTWTFYGSVGRAASLGIGFLPVYLGPTIVMLLAPVLLRKVLRVAKIQRSTSIADFIAGRYGKSHLLGGLTALIAVFGITPYIALQLKAISVSFDVLTGVDAAGMGGLGLPVALDTAFYVAVIMAAFAIVFGTRHIDAAEHHPGMVAAIALESTVKLAAFLAVGAFVVWGLHGSAADLFAEAQLSERTAKLLTAEPPLTGGSWVTTALLSMAAILLLPRQFQTMVIENVDERHLNKAAWLFPLYLLLINLFVLPVALSGLLRFPDGAVDPDVFVLALPLLGGSPELALLAFIGGLSAGAGMIVVEAIALSTMICNDLVMPVLLRLKPRAMEQLTDLSRLLLAIRRFAIVAILALGYAYYRFAGSAYALVAIGLISFAAVAQFAPALIGGVFWRRGTRRGALAGMGAGILVWLYTLLLPSFARSGWLPSAFMGAGPVGDDLLHPYALFGVVGMDPLTHALFWSMLANIGLYVLVSLFDRPTWSEQAQAAAYVEVFSRGDARALSVGRWRGSATVADLKRVTARFLGPRRADAAFMQFIGREEAADPQARAPADMVVFAERLLAGAVGAASARVALASAVKGEEVGADEIMRMLDETSQVIEYSRQLEFKTHQLEEATAALTAANERLKELDRLKDDFLSTVTHELRTPLTSIRALSEILFDDPDIDPEQRQTFLGLVISESERLTRLINQVLDMAKIEAGEMDWNIAPMAINDAARQAAAAAGQLLRDKHIDFQVSLAEGLPAVDGDHDRLVQVMVNLLSNAAKFTPEGGVVSLITGPAPTDLVQGVLISVADSGPGIDPAHHDVIFDRFRQVGDTMTDKPAGTGLGLAISKRIVEGLGGCIWVESAVGAGATFKAILPAAGSGAVCKARGPSSIGN
jgi:Na+/proline symporter/nitrogen-specific signal transduction histidine kinase